MRNVSSNNLLNIFLIKKAFIFLRFLFSGGKMVDIVFIMCEYTLCIAECDDLIFFS